jgi:hypothetical protein
MNYSLRFTPWKMGESIGRQLIDSELDLNPFLRQAMGEHVSGIMEELNKDTTLCPTFGSQRSIRY